MTIEQVTRADGRVTLYRGNCFALLPNLDPDDACITDPHYCMIVGRMAARPIRRHWPPNSGTAAMFGGTASAFRPTRAGG